MKWFKDDEAIAWACIAFMCSLIMLSVHSCQPHSTAPDIGKIVIECSQADPAYWEDKE